MWSNTVTMSQELVKKINAAVVELQSVLRESEVIVITYSGGKDSTAVTHLALAALCTLRKRPQTHIVAVDTLVEIPTVVSHSLKFLKGVETWANKYNLPLKVHILHPEAHETYWSCLIGKGYIPPRHMFRWCVPKLKIKPVRNMIREMGDGVIVLMGMRKDESEARKRSIKKRSIQGRWIRFEGADNARVFLPIIDWTASDVWEFLLKTTPPWGISNGDLYSLYFHSFDECTWSPNGGFSCNGNRFGCWTCTVVKKDTAMENLSKRDSVLKELLHFKLWLKEMASNDMKRCAYNRKGKPGKGPFTLSARKEIYNALKALGKRLGIQFLTDEEDKAIKRIWRQDKQCGFFDVPFTESVRGI